MSNFYILMSDFAKIGIIWEKTHWSFGGWGTYRVMMGYLLKCYPNIFVLYIIGKLISSSFQILYGLGCSNDEGIGP